MYSLSSHRWMIAGSPGRGRFDVLKTHPIEIKCFEKRIDNANRIALTDPIIEAFRQQR